VVDWTACVTETSEEENALLAPAHPGSRDLRKSSTVAQKM
jgi:hypothetical protein